MESRHHRRHYEILLRYAVEVGIENDVHRMFVVVVEFEAGADVVHHACHAQHLDVRSRQFVYDFELTEKLHRQVEYMFRMPDIHIEMVQ